MNLPRRHRNHDLLHTEATMTPDDRKTTRKIRRHWETRPATNHNGQPALVQLQLGEHTFYLPLQMAVSVANGLVDAVEDQQTTIWHISRTGQNIAHHP